MSSDRVRRFHERKKILQSNRNIYEVGDPSRIKSLLESKEDFSLLDSFDARWDHQLGNDISLNVSRNEVVEAISEIRKQIGDKERDALFDSCRDAVLSSIIKPFGLSRALFQDKDGGNVDTIHNVRNDVYSTNEERDRYHAREEYISGTYHSHENYIAANKKFGAQQKEGLLVDAYTGTSISNKEKMNLDHTIAAKEIHDDPGRVLAGVKGEDLANKQSNLNPTNESINKSKKQ